MKFVYCLSLFTYMYVSAEALSEKIPMESPTPKEEGTLEVRFKDNEVFIGVWKDKIFHKELPTTSVKAGVVGSFNTF
ncbi:hypothetical protein COU76_02275 [Candidatus Peregrinibacteria bacterium CG10_big_fil_rev_8_21_14_0_10_49_10]|nr:MAG: hypothetical protein COU76_02275 [Candidatus Peregrinibacteria bacterium CG10_big_fil_rev_8_21_14_0_10_49_10]